MQEERYVVGKGKLNAASSPSSYDKGTVGLPSTRPQNFKELIQQRVSVLQPSHKLVTALTNDSTLSAFNKLIQNKLLSLPLYSVEKQCYIGFLDIIDILNHFLSVLSEEEINTGFIHFQKHLEEVTCADVSNLSGCNPFKAIDNSAPLQSAIRLICGWKVHRVPLIDINGTLETVLSQSYLVKHLARYVQLTPFVNTTIAELKLGYKEEVFTISQHNTIKDAFSLMCSKDISGLGVVDHSGDLIGVVSVSDLRIIGFNEDMFSHCFLPIKDFLLKTGQHLVKVDPQSTVGRVAQIFGTTGVHRIFVVKDKKAIGVISLFDFIQLYDK